MITNSPKTVSPLDLAVTSSNVVPAGAQVETATKQMGRRKSRIRTEPAKGWRSWLELTKPKIVLLMLVTCASAMVVAEGGMPGIHIMVTTIASLACVIGGASTINHVLDRDFDRKMLRTRMRPVAAGVIGVGPATVFGVGLMVIGTTALYVLVNPLAAACALFGGIFYDLVYTPLKRVTLHNTVLGGVAGAMPPLVGWVAITESLDSVLAWMLFGIMFLWQPAHFWPLSLLIQREYSEAGFKMMPAERGERATVLATWHWTLITVVATYVPIVTGDVGVVYGAGATLANIYLIRRMRALLLVDRARGRDEHTAASIIEGDGTGRAAAVKAFLGSMVWLAIVFIALVVDALVR